MGNSAVERGVLHALDDRAVPYVLERSNPTIRQSSGFLLLHGLGVDKDEYLGFYRTLSASLSRRGFDVLRIDLPGHGESRASHSQFTLINCMADAIVAAKHLVDHLAVGGLRIFGTSFGAGPALIAADFFQEHLHSVTLLAPALSYGDLYVSPADTVRAQRYGTFYRDAIARGQAIQITDRVEFTWRNALEFAVVNIDDVLSRVAERTSVIHGDADSMVPTRLSRQLASRHPSLKLVVVPGMDHGFMDEHDELGIGHESQKNIDLILREALRP